MPISFAEVPSNARVPGTYIEISNALANSAEATQRVLIIAPKEGSATKNQKVDATSLSVVSAVFGANGKATQMFAIMQAQKLTLPITILAVESAEITAPTLKVLGDTQYHAIASTFNNKASIDALTDWLKNRYHALQQIPGIAFFVAKDTIANLKTKGTAHNSPFAVIIGINSSDKADHQVLAAYTAQCAQSLSNDPVIPLRTLALNTIRSNATNEWTWEERNQLLHNGISTYTVSDGDKQIHIERPITTYKSNAQGEADNSYLDVTTVATAMFFRSKQKALINARFGRYKLAADGTNFAPGQKVLTPTVFKASLLSLYQQLEERGIVQNTANYQATMIVELDDVEKSRINYQDQPQFVNGMLISAGLIEFTK